MNNGSGTVLEHDAQIPHESFMGGIVDSHGDAVRRKPNLIERADRNMSEKVELTKGTLWLLGAGVVILNLAISYGGSLIGWTREDQAQREKLNTTADKISVVDGKVDRLDTKFDKLAKDWNDFQLKQAEKRGYELKAAEGSHGKE